MRALVASLSRKTLATFFAATLALGLIPAFAFAAPDGLQSIPEGSEGTASVAFGAEGGSFDVFSHCPSDDASSVDGGSAVASSENVPDTGDDRFSIARDLDVLNQEVTLNTVVAQAESTKSFFLAQTLESTRTIPMVSASLPMDSSQGVVSIEASESEHTGEIAPLSTVIGSFEYLGMTFAIEAGGESVVLVAGDYTKLPQEFIEKQVVVIPDMVTPDGIDFYNVTRIADNAFAGFTKKNADPDHVGCEALLADEELLAKAGLSMVEAKELWDREEAMSDIEDDEKLDASAEQSKDHRGILILAIPACMNAIKMDSLAGFETLEFLIEFGDDAAISRIHADGAQQRLGVDERLGAFLLDVVSALSVPRTSSFSAAADQASLVDRNAYNGTYGGTFYGAAHAGGVAALTSTAWRTAKIAADQIYLKQSNGSVMAATDISGTSGGIVSGMYAPTKQWYVICWNGSEWETAMKLGSSYKQVANVDGYWYLSASEKPSGKPSNLLVGSVIKTHKVTWKGNGGTFAIDSGTASESASQAALDVGVKPTWPTQASAPSGFTFKGWNTKQDFSGTCYTDESDLPVMANIDVTYYAQWEYTDGITFVYQDGRTPDRAAVTATKVYDADTVFLDTTVAKPSNDEGWSFAGWATSPEGISFGANLTDAIEANSTIIEPTSVYYGRWNAVVSHITAGGVSTVSEATVWRDASDPSTYSDYVLPAGPAPVDALSRHFSGWSVMSGNEYVKGAPSATQIFEAETVLSLKGPVTLTARYDDNLITINWFDGDGTTLKHVSTEVVYGTTLDGLSAEAELAEKSLSPNPGYHLLGWNIDPAATSALSGSTKMTATTNLYPIYERNGLIEVSLLARDGSLLPERVYLWPDMGFVLGDSGAAAETLADANTFVASLSETGYEFCGFSDAGRTMIDDSGHLTKEALAIRQIPSGTQWSSIWKAKEYEIVIDLAGGTQDNWHDGAFSLTYDDPILSLPANNGKLKRSGYAFRCFEAFSGEDSEPAVVYGRNSQGEYVIPTTALYPGESYRVLNLGAEGGDIDRIVAVWESRIAVTVPATMKLGVLADMPNDRLVFQAGKESFSSSSDEDYAPMEFISYTNAPIGIVEVRDDGSCTDFAKMVFKNKHELVKLTLADEPKAANSLSLGSFVKASSGYLDGLRIEAAETDAGTVAEFFLGMDFGEGDDRLKPSDIELQKSGDIAKLYYTVALLKDDAITDDA